jgi:hypothetical protein
METYDESDAGYPEEQPPSDAEDPGSDVRDRARPAEEAERAPDSDDGKATGNPGAAG